MPEPNDMQDAEDPNRLHWLAISRRVGEKFYIGDSEVVVRRVRGNRVYLAIGARECVKVLREEISLRSPTPKPYSTPDDLDNHSGL